MRTPGGESDPLPSGAAPSWAALCCVASFGSAAAVMWEGANRVNHVAIWRP